MKNNSLEKFEGEGSKNKLLERYWFTTTKISKGKLLVYGGSGNNSRNKDNMLLIKIVDVIFLTFHIIETTGMLDYLGRNMCEEVYSVMWLFIYNII